MKKRNPKLESTRKIEQDKPFQKILTFGQGQHKSQSQQVHGQSQLSVNNYMTWVGLGFLGRVTNRAAETLTSSYEVALTRITNDLAYLRVADVDRLMSS